MPGARVQKQWRNTRYRAKRARDWLMLAVLAVCMISPLPVVAGNTEAGVGSGSAIDAVPSRAYDGDILLVGEAHGHRRSYEFVSALIDNAMARRRCVTLAVEVRADQAAAWRAGKRLKLTAVHDSLPLRAWLKQLAARAQSECLTLVPIDAEPGVTLPEPGGRDALMANRIAQLIAPEHLVIALVGNNHAPRRVDWIPSGLDSSAGLYLTRAGHRPFVILQAFSDVSRVHRVLSGNTLAAVGAFNALQWYKHVRSATAFTPYADLLIDWVDDVPR